jgi:ATP-dependent 26S proteasome regulatory subunit
MESIQPYIFMALSNMKNENSNSSNNIYLYALLFLIPIISKIIPFNDINDYLLKIIKNYYENDYISISIQSHSVPVVKSWLKTAITKEVFSTNFLALIWYLIKNHISEFESLAEIITSNSELNMGYDYESPHETKFLLMPNGKVKICKKNDIYCEIININNKDDDDDDGKKNKKDKLITKKSYIIKLSMKKTNQNLESYKSLWQLIASYFSLNKYSKNLQNSYKMDILQEFLSNCVEDYQKNNNPKKNDKKYIFQYKSFERTESCNTTLNFEEYTMEHNKDLVNNIFFEGKDKMLKYIDPFIYDPFEKINIGEEKYKRSGVTFKAGLLFHGSPGCGKTSTLKAIAKYTNRNIVNIPIDRVKTCEELELIIRARCINGKNFSGKELIFVFEEFDIQNSDAIVSRQEKDVEKDVEKEKESNEKDSQKNSISTMLQSEIVALMKAEMKSDHDKLNLSCFLQLFDGIIELHGIIIILTTNYPEKIDSALLRPGRIDFIHEFKKASRKVILDMLKFKFEISDIDLESYEDILNIKDEVLSPATIQQICFKHENIEECIKDILLAQ